MSYGVRLLPRAEEDLADAARDPTTRLLILEGLERAAQDALSASYHEQSGAHVLVFYVPTPRGAILAYAAFDLRGSVVEVNSMAFIDEGDSLHREPPTIL